MRVTLKSKAGLRLQTCIIRPFSHEWGLGIRLVVNRHIYQNDDAQLHATVGNGRNEAPSRGAVPGAMLLGRVYTASHSNGTTGQKPGWFAGGCPGPPSCPQAITVGGYSTGTVVPTHSSPSCCAPWPHLTEYTPDVITGGKDKRPRKCSYCELATWPASQDSHPHIYQAL